MFATVLDWAIVQTTWRLSLCICHIWLFAAKSMNMSIPQTFGMKQQELRQGEKMQKGMLKEPIFIWQEITREVF